MSKIYPFTNENIAKYPELYNFSNAQVLSVLGSGDQYFISLLNDALKVDVYDNNYQAWEYFVLKYYAILILNYEEFYNYFITSKLNNITYYQKIRNYLPNVIQNSWDKYYTKYKKVSIMFNNYYELFNYNFIPYFNEKEYYRLQNILRNNKLPIFYFNNLANLPNSLNSNYDLLLTSNIFNNLYINYDETTVKEYKNLLQNFNCKEIQAMYSWWLDNQMHYAFLDNSFKIDLVPQTMKNKNTSDYVISLIRK